MSERRIYEYERNAAECRKIAAALQNPGHKQKLQEIAAAWDMLAEELRTALGEKSKFA